MAERPDPDTDPNTLAEYFVEWADSVDPLWQGGFCSDNDALRERAMNARAAADGLRQLAAITAALGAIDRTWDGYTFAPHDVSGRVNRTRLLARGQIAASLSPTPSDVTAELNCPECGGYGWFAEHDPNTGEPMIPQPCPTCDQSGKVTAHVVDHIERLPF